MMVLSWAPRGAGPGGSGGRAGRPGGPGRSFLTAPKGSMSSSGGYLTNPLFDIELCVVVACSVLFLFGFSSTSTVLGKTLGFAN